MHILCFDLVSSVFGSFQTLVGDVYHLLVNEQLLKYLPHILLALLLGSFLGLERRSKHKAAGLRTHMIICAASALITICGVVMTVGSSGDPTRLAGQLLAGIGFIGAGVILKRGISTQGVTTSATILLAVGIGMTCGFGLFTLATVVTLLMIGMLLLTARVFRSNDFTRPVTISCKWEKRDDVRKLFGRHNLMGGFDKRGENVEFTLQPDLTPKEFEALLERLLENPDVFRVRVIEIDG